MAIDYGCRFPGHRRQVGDGRPVIVRYLLDLDLEFLLFGQEGQGLEVVQTDVDVQANVASPSEEQVQFPGLEVSDRREVGAGAGC